MWPRRWVTVLGLVVMYVVTARLGLLLALPPEKKATAIWVPSGIALAAVLLYGRRLWPGIWLGAFLANLWDYSDPANAFSLAAHVAVSSGIATGSTLQALAGSVLLRRLVGPGSPFERTSSAFAFAGVAMVMCLVAATFGVASLYLGGFAPAKALGFIWWTWWLGDMTGVLTAGSLILAWSRLPTFAWEPRRLAEAAFLLVLLVLLGVGVFGLGPFDFHVPAPLAYLTIPVLVWATFRFGLHGATVALFLISGIAVWGTSEGDGPFAQPTVQASLLLLQVYMGVIAVTALVMAAMLDERSGAEAKVHLWEHIAAHAGWPVVIVDPRDSTLHLVNRAFADMHGYTVDELNGSSLADLCAPESRAELPAHRRAIHEKGNHVYESVHMRKDGSRFPCRCHGTAFKDAHGQVLFRAGTFQDLTKFKQAEAVLRESEQRLRQLADTIPQLAWMARPDGHIFWYNRRWHEYTGTTAEDMEGWGWQSVHDPKALPKVLERWKGSVASGEPFDMVFPIKGADGLFRPFLTRVNPLRDEAHRILNWFGTNTDISEQMRAEAQLHELNATLEQRVNERTAALRVSEGRFRAIFDLQLQFIGLMSPDGVLLEANRTALAATGVSEEAVLGKPFWETVWWAHDSVQQDRLRDAVTRAAAGHTVRFEASHPGPDGSLIWVDFCLTPFRDDDGNVTLLIPEGHDITERKRIEEVLREQEERFRSAFDFAAIGMALVAPDGKWLRVNRGICDIVGYSEAELLATDFQSITHPDDLAADLDLVRAVLADTIRTYQMEKRYFHKQGRIVHVLLSVSLVRDGAGRPLYFIAQIQDITVRKRSEEQMATSLREKETLLKEIHHRVKNNLQIVSTLLDLQSDHTSDPQTLEMFRESRGRVKSMALIHERLYRSQDMARVDFAEYVRQLADDLYRTYKLSDDIRLELDIDIPPLPIDLAIPCGLLLNELMSNCFKHAFAGATEGCLRVALRRDGSGANVLIVADTGPGFPADTDFRNTASFGLQLVNTLVEQLDGEIELTAERGTTFTVRFPKAKT